MAEIKTTSCRSCGCITDYYTTNCYKRYESKEGPRGPPKTRNPIKLAFGSSSGIPGTCFIHNDKLYTMGIFAYGYNISDPNITPTVLSAFNPPESWVKVIASRTNVMALGSNGNVYVMGENDVGQLGNGSVSGTEQKYMTAVKINDLEILENIVDISGPLSGVSLGSATLSAISKNGEVYVWGNGINGCLGDGTTPASIVFASKVVYFDGTSDKFAVSMSMGPIGDESHFAVVTKTGTAVTWGAQNEGCLGNLVDSTTPVASPFAVPNPPETFKLPYVSGNNIRFLMSDGTTMAAGANLVGEIGNGNQVQNNIFEFGIISGTADVLENIIKLEMVGDETFTVALDTSSRLWYCGSNTRGQAGDGTVVNVETGFEQISHSKPIINFWTFGSEIESAFVLFQDSTNAIYGAGSNASGQLAAGSPSSSHLTFIKSLIDPRIRIIDLHVYGRENQSIDNNTTGCAILSLEDGSAIGIGAPTSGQTGVWSSLVDISIVEYPRSVFGFL